MKHRHTFIIALTLLCSLSLRAQVDTKGTDFWLSFGNINNEPMPTSVTLQIRIVADEAAAATITFTDIIGAGRTVTANVLANSVYTHTLSMTEKNAAYNVTTGTTDKSIRIQSDVPVTVYALNTVLALADATNVLPVPVLGNDHYHLGLTGVVNGSDQYFVVATQNGTIVSENGVPVATLSEGQVYFRQASGTTDMSGYHITSNNPVAYFSAHAYAIMQGGGDNFFQQLPPVNTWGQNFMIPVTNRALELVRIVASLNNTVITQTGGTVTTGSLTLNAGEWVELRILLVNNGCYIQADKPVQVCSYMVGQNYPGAVAPFGSDEALCWVPPIEQSVKTALIAPFAVSTLSYHFALIVTPTNTKDNTTLSIGGAAPAALTGGTWYDNPVSGMSFYNVQLTNATASYFFANTNGLIAYAYGFGNHISYYYMAGSAIRDLDAAFYVNDIHHQDLPSEVFTISQMDFRAEIQDAMSSQAGHLKWYIDDVEETAAEDLLTWSKTLSNGVYAVKMEVLLADNVTVKIVESTLVIGVAFDMEICAGKGVTFTVTPHNGGSSPSYQWMVNSSPIGGATASTFYYVPSDGDVVVCELTSSEDCLDSNPVLSHSITVMVKGPATITTPTPPVAVCAGSTLSLTTPPIDLGGATLLGGTWTLNGVNFNTSTPMSYTQNGLGLAYKIETECGTFTSSTVAVTVKDKPSLGTLSAPPCIGTGQTLALSAPSVNLNGGSQTGATWTLNGATITTSSTFNYSDHGKTLQYAVANECGTTTSNPVTICVQDVPTVTIPCPLGPPSVCEGTALNLTSCTPTINLNGQTQVGQGSWTLNASTWTPGTLTAGTYSLGYRINTTPYGIVNSSNTVTATIMPMLTPAATITASDNNVCAGTSITYTVSNMANQGSSPGYQWRVNASPVVGEISSTFVYEPDNGDIITCVLTSNAACVSLNPVTSNAVTMTVTPTVIPSVSVLATPD